MPLRGNGLLDGGEEEAPWAPFRVTTVANVSMSTARLFWFQSFLVRGGERFATRDQESMLLRAGDAVVD